MHVLCRLFAATTYCLYLSVYKFSSFNRMKRNPISYFNGGFKHIFVCHASSIFLHTIDHQWYITKKVLSVVNLFILTVPSSQSFYILTANCVKNVTCFFSFLFFSFLFFSFLFFSFLFFSFLFFSFHFISFLFFSFVLFFSFSFLSFSVLFFFLL